MEAAKQRLNGYDNMYSTRLLYNNEIEKVLDPYNWTGFIRCDLYYTKEQKEKLKFFPPLPIHAASDAFPKSEYMKSVRDKLDEQSKKKSIEDKSKKLIYGLFPLPMYDIYSETLKYLLENDMVTLYHVHTAVSTPTDFVFRDFIKEMTNKRQIASDMIKQSRNDISKYSKEALSQFRNQINSTNEFNEDIEIVKNADAMVQKGNSMKDFAKINNNSCYGKTIQSDENFTTSEIVTTSKEFLKKSIGKVLIDFNILAPKTDEHPGTVEFKVKKEEVNIKAPKYIGSAVLWFSKMLMIDFVYNCLYKVFAREEVKLLYTDTDSLYISFIGENAPLSYEDLLQRVEEKDPILRQRHFSVDEFDVTPGVMKCEKEIEEAVFLQPKCYCLVTKDNKTIPRAKGSILSQNKDILEDIDNYKNSLNIGYQVKGANTLFKKVDKVHMETQKQTKFILTPYDNKRKWLNKNESIPWGFDDSNYDPDDTFNRILKNCRSARDGIYSDISEVKFLEYLDCPIEQFKAEFEENMKKIKYCTYMNYGTYWNVDHTIPVDSGKGKQGEELENFLKIICNHSNLVPMLVVENSRKKNKLTPIPQAIPVNIIVPNIVPNLIEPQVNPIEYPDDNIAD